MVQNSSISQPLPDLRVPGDDDGKTLTIVVTTPEAVDILFGILTIPRLAEIAHVPRAWLNNATNRLDDPLPTTQRGDKKGVWYWEFVEWYNRNYGLNGTRRGLDGSMGLDGSR